METMLDFILRGAQHILSETILNPVFLGAVGAILLLERIFPADREQPLFSKGLAQDALWVVLALVFQATIVAVYAKAIKSFYDSRLSFLTITSLNQTPEVIRMGIAVLVADFLAWFQHWVKHKVPWFWQIHAVHHSQKQLNVFTDYRFHLGEYLISRPIVMLPLLVLSIETPKLVAYSLFTAWYPRLYHANIRSNFGFLRYIFVTPQSHRVHHSIEARHIDLNFGVIFSFWDRMFGTANKNAEEYPKTGIKDGRFPIEHSASPWGLLQTALRQLIYPLQVIAREISGKK